MNSVMLASAMTDRPSWKMTVSDLRATATPQRRSARLNSDRAFERVEKPEAATSITTAETGVFKRVRFSVRPW
jgi:hypothetical protein